MKVFSLLFIFSQLKSTQKFILRHKQLVVFPLLGEQLLVRSSFKNASLIDIQDAGCIFDGGEAVCDDEGGTAFQQLV